MVDETTAVDGGVSDCCPVRDFFGRANDLDEVVVCVTDELLVLV